MKVLIALLIFLACERTKFPSTGPGPKPVTMDTLYQLDMLHPVIKQSLASLGPGLDKFKFVEVEVTHVINPKNLPVLITVYYQASGSESKRLGLFSLYPNNNPGTFIVPTAGLLRADGEIELRLEKPEDYHEGDVLELSGIKLKLRES